MFKINDNAILADDLQVLTELKDQLALNGIDLLRKFKPGVNNIQFCCPYHNHGQERKPSCGISTIDQERTPAGTVHCFTCGYTSTLEEMISFCFGKDDQGSFGKDWLIKNFLTIAVENRKPLVLDLHRKTHDDAHTAIISEDELYKYRLYHPYMYTRKLTDEIIEKFDVGYDADFKLKDKAENEINVPSITFPVRDIKGNTLFFVRRAIHQKLFHYPEGVNKPIYGIYELPKNAKEVIICESVINALTCYVYGKPAVALLGTGTKGQYEELRRLSCRKFILALDPDKAGRIGQEKLKKALQGNKLVTSYVLPPNKDINDLSECEFKNLIEIF